MREEKLPQLRLVRRSGSFFGWGAWGGCFVFGWGVWGNVLCLAGVFGEGFSIKGLFECLYRKKIPAMA